jgi:hypothetical protein
MSEADTPQSPNSSFHRNDDCSVNDPLDELIAALDESEASEEASETESNSDPSFFEYQTEEKQGEALSHQLQKQNHELLNRSAQLQQELETTQAQLEQHQFRLRQAEDLNAQQNDELNAAYEQNLSLSQELKTVRQKEQEQEETIANLSHQLEVSQQRVAQLERECALIQKQFQEQSYKLCQAEKKAQDLSLRLQQQRRHTWQFKCALNKYLETNGDNYSHDAFSMNSVPSQPIPAWSTQQKPVDSTTEEPASIPVSSLTEEEKSLPEMTESAIEQPQVNPPEQTFSATEETQVNSSEESLDRMEIAISLPDFEETWRSPTQETAASHRPAPTVHAPQNRKKRKSYASVQLPNFIR